MVDIEIVMIDTVYYCCGNLLVFFFRVDLCEKRFFYNVSELIFDFCRKLAYFYEGKIGFVALHTAPRLLISAVKF